MQWYTKEFGDFLMADPPRWFQSIVTVEIFLQLPFFFVAAYGFWQGASLFGYWTGQIAARCVIYSGWADCTKQHAQLPPRTTTRQPDQPRTGCACPASSTAPTSPPPSCLSSTPSVRQWLGGLDR